MKRGILAHRPGMAALPPPNGAKNPAPWNSHSKAATGRQKLARMPAKSPVQRAMALANKIPVRQADSTRGFALSDFGRANLN